MAADASVAAFCEKPIALDLGATDAVIDHVKRSGIFVQIGFQRRFDAGYRAAREAVRSGALGDVRLMAQQPQGRAKTKTGTAFALTLGVMYEIDKQGKLAGTEVAPFTRSTWQLPPPPRAGGPG